MANNMYSVMKDGLELSTLKTLSAAKKLADAEETEVFTGGKCVYKGVQQVKVTVESVVVQNPAQPDEQRVETIRYRLKNPDECAEASVSGQCHCGHQTRRDRRSRFEGGKNSRQTPACTHT